MIKHIDEILETLNSFGEVLQEDYSLDNIEIYEEKTNDKTNFGYKVEHNKKEFIIFMEHDQINENEYKLSDNSTWILKYNNQISTFKTIGELMDEIFDVLENKAK